MSPLETQNPYNFEWGVDICFLKMLVNYGSHLVPGFVYEIILRKFIECMQVLSSCSISVMSQLKMLVIQSLSKVNVLIAWHVRKQQLKQ